MLKRFMNPVKETTTEENAMLTKYNFRRLGLVAMMAGFVAACDNPLAVKAPGVLTADELTGPGAIGSVVNGIVGDFAEALDNYVLYTSMFTDEMILAGTFPTRKEVDERRIVPDNATVTGGLYEPIHVSRFSADTAAVNFSAAQSDPDFAAVLDLLDEGTVYAKFYGGYSRILLAELYCESTLSAGPFLVSDDRMTEAMNLLAEAEADAAAAGLDDIENAAIVGQARANLWLGNYTAAAAHAARVDAGFEYHQAYSTNDNVQFNEVYSLTHGRGGQVIRWTVGDGTLASRNFEKFAYYDEWVALGRINPASGKRSFDSTIPVRLQLLYASGDAGILLASKAEADMIEAEAAIRAGQFTTADDLVNPYRSAWGLTDLDFGAMANLNARLTQLAQERNREMWLTGERQGTLRRLLENDGLDLYPANGGAGTQTCFPIVQQELDNNSNSLNFPANQQ
ncbi:MAG: RagB/SusD family nutrient uptake outer membrane protein [Gemmatimonadota bacterium]|nr:RagB/SusD family nutrient uptake outer membrane protein [Gemmatimonadota bacterium]MDH5804223.1 RagB/SusD family nutrient uptake outer membrane protein [Gemmatimonadota bacterium]